MLRGMGKIFSFTFTQQVRKKGYRTAVLIGVLLCLLGPIIGMALTEKLSGQAEQPEVVETNAKVICAVDLTEPGIEDFSFLNDLGTSESHFIYRTYSSVEEAKAAARQDPQSLIGVLDQNATGYIFSLILPDDTTLSQEDADNAETLLTPALSVIPMQKAGISVQTLQVLTQPLETELHVENTEGADLTDAVLENTEESGEADTESVRQIVATVATYLNVMVLYFLILFYGQAAARQVVLEKSSKLMDTFLISVRPESMVFGKVLAEACSSILQVGCWIIALIGGFAIGGQVVLWINPDSTMALLQLFSALGDLNSFLSIPGAILALVVMLAGFLLYCGLAAIGGAIAGKDEDLSNTNALFTLVLIISFFVVLYSGNLFDSAGGGVPLWQDLVPFTALLVVPGQLLTGVLSLPVGLLSLAILLVTTGIFLYLAGRIYRMMALYKGEVPKLSQVFGMLLKR